MKIATAIAMMLENWRKPNVCTKIMFLLCKMALFYLLKFSAVCFIKLII